LIANPRKLLDAQGRHHATLIQLAARI